MEEEARLRYLEFSRLVGGRYPGDAADVFKQMAGYEERHGAQLRERRRALFQDQPARVTLEDLDEVEAPDRGKPRVFMSVRDALEVALASEEKAWAFFDGALKQVKEPLVRVLFQELREEEAAHRALLAGRLKGQKAGPDLTEGEVDAPGSDGG
jgi:rubrerythrin